MKTLVTDYLVIGAGTSGLAFADTLLQQSDAHITIVDRGGKPGGHWNDAYPFVTLHQPSAFYGVNSLELGSGRKDSIGPNQGLYELASGAEVCGYFDRVMQSHLLPSGRVRYLPMCSYGGDGRVESLLTGEQTQIQVRRKTIDSTYLSPQVPSRHQRRFSASPGARLVAPNALPALAHQASSTPLPRRFVIIGAGKTAMDTCLWLLSVGVPATALTWVKPREAWLVNRLTTQSGPEFFFDAIGSQAAQMEAVATATSVSDLFLRLEDCGALLRIDTAFEPSMFHLATVSQGEVDLLRTITQVVRRGRVQAVAADHLLLDDGQLPLSADTLCIDCTASAVEPRPLQPIFQEGQVVLQLVRLPQPAFSSALIGYVEAHGADKTDAELNALCATVPFPHTLADYPRAIAVGMQNQMRWGQDKALRQWIRESRLDGFGRLMSSVGATETDKLAVLARFKAAAGGAAANLPRLLDVLA